MPHETLAPPPGEAVICYGCHRVIFGGERQLHYRLCDDCGARPYPSRQEAAEQTADRRALEELQAFLARYEMNGHLRVGFTYDLLDVAHRIGAAWQAGYEAVVPTNRLLCE